MGHALTFAVTWEPFLRGIIVVLIGIAVLCGSVYILCWAPTSVAGSASW